MLGLPAFDFNIHLGTHGSILVCMGSILVACGLNFDAFFALWGGVGAKMAPRPSQDSIREHLDPTWHPFWLHFCPLGTHFGTLGLSPQVLTILSLTLFYLDKLGYVGYF